MTFPRFPLLPFSIASLMVPAILAAQNPIPKTVAQAMASALRRNAKLHPRDALSQAVGKPHDEFFSTLVEKAAASAGESLSGRSKMQIHIAARSYYVARLPISDAQRADYLARLDRIDKATIQALSPSQTVDAGVYSLIATVLPFYDFLFAGPQWKRGNPEAAIARWKSIPQEAKSVWEQAATDASVGDPSFAPWSLLAVDPLFRGGAFQLQLFNEALPVAKQLLKPQR